MLPSMKEWRDYCDIVFKSAFDSLDHIRLRSTVKTDMIDRLHKMMTLERGQVLTIDLRLWCLLYRSWRLRWSWRAGSRLTLRPNYEFSVHTTRPWVPSS